MTLAGLLDAFGERILPFDDRVAHVYRDIAAKARLAGKGLPKADGYIAVTAVFHG